MGMFPTNWLKELFVDSTPAGTTDVAAPARGRFNGGPVMLAFATQTGAAESIAEATLEQLEMAGVDAHMMDFYDLSVPLLQQHHQWLLVTSTTFDGDPPDMAETFCQDAMGSPVALPHLRFGLLGLGDRAYDTFCGFGHRLDDWLRASGALPWFDMIEVDDEDETAIDRWHAYVAALSASVPSTP